MNRFNRDLEAKLAEAQRQGRKSQVQTVRLSSSLLEARLRGTGGDAATTRKALHDLERLLEELRRRGPVVLELEARLAIGELGMQSGRADAPAILDALEKETAQKGFGLISRKAAAARVIRSASR